MEYIFKYFKPIALLGQLLSLAIRVLGPSNQSDLLPAYPNFLESKQVFSQFTNC